MRDSFGDITKGQKAERVCRAAYTLNNSQPVICTIVGDQPLFYMDYDYAYEDEENLSFDAAGEGVLENEINSLKDQLESIDRLSASYAVSGVEKVEQFLSDASDITSAENKVQTSNIEDLLEILRESRLATAYLAKAEEHDVSVEYSQQVETAQYDRKSKKILINPNTSFVDQQLLAAQELRRHWQHRQGVLINPLMFHPDNSVLVNRAQVADLLVSIIRVAWELQLSNQKDAWERIENSSLADLGRAFAREAYLDFRTINNGQASAAVFEAWFLTERCRAQDKVLINQMLADYKGYVFDIEECEQQITPALIAGLGEMPFGKNYLAEHAVTIMEDAIFTDVRDRSNANFLWFIKFERSFRESEQELQTSSSPSAEDIRTSVSQTSEDLDNAFQQGAEQEYQGQADIITLFAQDAKTVPEESGDHAEQNTKRLVSKNRDENSNGSEGNTSNIVYLRRWSGE